MVGAPILTINPVELIVGTWTAVAVIGVGVSIWATVDSLLDRRVQRQTRVNSALWVVVTVNLRSAQASLLLHAFFLFLGIRAFLVPPVTNAAGFAFASVGFIVVAAVNVRSVGLNQLDRLRLRRSVG